MTCDSHFTTPPFRNGFEAYYSEFLRRSLEYSLFERLLFGSAPVRACVNVLSIFGIWTQSGFGSRTEHYKIMDNLDRIKNAVSKTVLGSTNDLKKHTSGFRNVQYSVHWQCSNMGKQFRLKIGSCHINQPILVPFRTLGGLHYGLTQEKGMVVGKPIYENLEQGFDVREALEMNFDTIKFVVVSNSVIFYYVTAFNVCYFSKCSVPW